MDCCTFSSNQCVLRVDLIYCDVMLKALFAGKVLILAYGYEPNGQWDIDPEVQKVLLPKNLIFFSFFNRLGHFVNFSVKLQKVTETERNSHRVISFL